MDPPQSTPALRHEGFVPDTDPTPAAKRPDGGTRSKTLVNWLLVEMPKTWRMWVRGSAKRS